MRGWPAFERVFLNRCERPITRFGIHALVERCAEAAAHELPSPPAERAGLHALLALHRGRWTVENHNHAPRDVTFREDDSRSRTGHGPAKDVTLNNLALAIVLRREFGTIPEGLTRFTVRRDEALQAILRAA